MFYTNLSSQNDCKFDFYQKNTTNEIKEFFKLKLRSDNLVILKSKSQIPHFIYKELKCNFGPRFKLAELNEEYSKGCTSNGNMPNKGLLFAAMNDSLFVMVYGSGGFAYNHAVICIQFKGNKIQNLWHRYLENINSKYTLKSILSYL